MLGLDDTRIRLRHMVADFCRRLLEEVREIYNDLQNLPIGIVIFVSCLALLLAASTIFGLHA